MLFIDFQPFRAVGKIIGYNDFVFILQITVILDFLLLQKIRRLFLVVGYDAAVKGIAKLFRNVRCKPPLLSQRRQPSRFLKLVLDGCYSHSIQVHSRLISFENQASMYAIFSSTNWNLSVQNQDAFAIGHLRK